MVGGTMRVLRIAGLGVVFWGLSLLWPQANQLLTTPVMIKMLIGLGAVAPVYVLIRRLNYHHNDEGVGQDRPSRPMPVALGR
jgi:hypothetical protein